MKDSKQRKIEQSKTKQYNLMSQLSRQKIS